MVFVGAIWISPLMLSALADFISPSLYRTVGYLVVASQAFVSILFLAKSSWLRTSRVGAFLRFFPALLWGVLVSFNLVPVTEVFGTMSRIGMFGPLLNSLITVSAGVLWLAPIRPPHSMQMAGRGKHEHALGVGLYRAVLDYSQSQRGQKSERRVNSIATVSFVVFSAIILNLFTLIGSLGHPLIHLTVILVAASLFWWTWKQAVEKQRRKGLHFSGAIGSQMALILVVVAGGVLFFLSLGIDMLDYESWVDRLGSQGAVVNIDAGEEFANSINRKDALIIGVQVFVLLIATGVPIGASWMYEDKTKVSVRREKVLYLVRGRPILEIDQRNCVVRACVANGFLWPRKIWLPVSVIRAEGDNILVYMQWRAKGLWKDSRYVYRYSEIVHGDTFALSGALRWTTRAAARLRAWVSGRNLVAWDKAEAQVVVPRNSYDTEDSYPYLSLHGVPPYIPSTVIPFRQKLLAPQPQPKLEQIGGSSCGLGLPE